LPSRLPPLQALLGRSPDRLKQRHVSGAHAARITLVSKAWALQISQGAPLSAGEITGLLRIAPVGVVGRSSSKTLPLAHRTGFQRHDDLAFAQRIDRRVGDLGETADGK